MSRRYRLYRHFNSAGDLLYIGISLNAIARLVDHKEDSPWFDDVVLIELQPFESKEAALEAERTAIETERPRFNVQHRNRKIKFAVATPQYNGEEKKRIGFLDWDDLRERGIKGSKPNINRLIREGLFPKPVKLGHSTKVWIESEIDEYVARKIAERDFKSAPEMQAAE